VHADGAAVHDTPDAGSARDLDDRADGFRVDGPVFGFREAGLTIHGSDVIDDFSAGGRACHGGAIPEISLHDPDAVPRELDGLCRIPDERGHVVAAPDEAAGEMAAGETSGPCDQDSFQNGFVASGLNRKVSGQRARPPEGGGRAIGFAFETIPRTRTAVRPL
jgi:hypothetical protein